MHSFSGAQKLETPHWLPGAGFRFVWGFRQALHNRSAPMSANKYEANKYEHKVGGARFENRRGNLVLRCVGVRGGEHDGHAVVQQRALSSIL